MSIKPILFNTEMVRAILDGRKTVTRRVIRGEGQREATDYVRRYSDDLDTSDLIDHWWVDTPLEHYTLYRPDDILYVRETWNYGYVETSDAEYSHEAWFEEMEPTKPENRIFLDSLARYFYRADSDDADCMAQVGGRWRPAIHMPREAARIFLRVTDVRVERLQEVTSEGAKAEGICGYNVGMGEVAYSAAQSYEKAKSSLYEHPVGAFAALWDSTIKPADRERYGWAANPWVWVIRFERCEKPEETET